jgi:alanyl-tRNA synthetase
MHAGLRKVLGTHVEQKGSLVTADRLRFDFAHFSKVNDDELKQIEQMVNAVIRQNIAIKEFNNISIDEAKAMGAMALFGEKYGDKVRAIQFGEDYSTELCGGTHVPATGNIGLFKIISEGAIAAGVRRIEAVTSLKAEAYYQGKLDLIDEISRILKEPKDLIKSVENLVESNSNLTKELDHYKKEKVVQLKNELIAQSEVINGVSFIAAKVELDMASIKDLAFSIIKSTENTLLVIGSENGGKANLTIMLDEQLIADKEYHAGNMIRMIAKEIRGGGGGQPHLATAGGANVNGIESAFKALKQIIQ